MGVRISPSPPQRNEMNTLIDFLTVIVLTLSATYLVFKVPDVISNGFEHGSNVYVELSAADFFVQPGEEEN